jgi:hypothetical protein
MVKTLAKKDFMGLIANAGQVERILACIEFSKALVSAYDMETLLTAVLERIKVLIPASNWSLLLVDRQTEELYFAGRASPDGGRHCRHRGPDQKAGYHSGRL